MTPNKTFPCKTHSWFAFSWLRSHPGLDWGLWLCAQFRSASTSLRTDQACSAAQTGPGVAGSPQTPLPLRPPGGIVVSSIRAAVQSSAQSRVCCGCLPCVRECPQVAHPPHAEAARAPLSTARANEQHRAHTGHAERPHLGHTLLLCGRARSEHVLWRTRDCEIYHFFRAFCMALVT